MCIYYSDRSDLHYTQQEHVIPAALGGQQKLPRGVVSDEANAYFSKIERRVLHTGLLSTSRHILGPGKRGKLAPKHRAIGELSPMRMMDSEEWGLGYISAGQPFLVPQFWIDGAKLERYSIHLPAFEEEAKLWELVREDEVYIEWRVFPELKDHCVLAAYKGHLVAAAPSEAEFAAIKKARKVLKAEPMDRLQEQERESQAEIQMNIEASLPDYYRLCGKTALNCAAHVFGQEFFTAHDCRSTIGWVVDEERKPEGVNFVDKHFPFDDLLGDAMGHHYVLLFPVEDYLLAAVKFYNSLVVILKLCADYRERFSIDGLICDWKARKEYAFSEFIVHFVREHNRFDLEEMINP